VSEGIVKEACPKCGSQDNLARWPDGHAHCFTPGCDHREPAGASVSEAPQAAEARRPAAPAASAFIPGEARALAKRGLSAETCAKWHYHVGEHHSRPVQIANYYDAGGVLTGQKLRYADKSFGTKGKLSLYGQHLWRDSGKMVVVTEGEIDALSVSQLQGNKWPVVSIPHGAQSAKKHLAAAMEWLLKFEHVVLMFDNDDAGQLALDECAPIFPPGRCKVARLPLKDANEMLVAGRGPEVIDAIWGARAYAPAGIVTLDDVREEALKAPETGLPWCFPALTELTYGRRLGEVHTFGAGTGIGKTDLWTQQIAFDLTELKEKVCAIFLETEPAELGKRLAGKVAGRLFHIPGAAWTQGELVGAFTSLQDSAPLFMFDHWGSCDWDSISSRIRHLSHGEGVRLFYLDHLTALAAGSEDERKTLESLMAEVAKLAKELRVVIHLISHLTTPEGKPHEEGGHVAIRHFKGSRAIGFWSHFMYALERNTMSEDQSERQRTQVRLLKARLCGWNVGKSMYLRYDKDDGRLYETELAEFEDHGAGDASF